MATQQNQAGPAQKYFPDLEAELATTRKTLERYPDGKGEWTPHAKSMPLGKLASHVAQLPKLGVMVLESDSYDVANYRESAQADTATELVARFDAIVSKLKPLLANTSDAVWQKEWRFTYGPNPIMVGPKAVILRTLLVNHLVHHRAQLGVYFRLLGIPVPSMYGPTADEQMAG